MRLQNKLFLSLVTFSVLLVGLMLGLMQWSVERGMLEYVNVQEEARLQPLLEQLASHYEANDGWQELRNDPGSFERMLWRSQSPAAQQQELPPKVLERRRQWRERPGKSPHRPRKPRPVLLDAEEQLVVGRTAPQGEFRKLQIVRDGQTVGWLALPSRQHLTEGYELSFVEQQMATLLAIGAMVIGLALLFAFFLSRHLLRPIGALASATGDMTRGNYEPTLDVQRRDELGQLARDFNELASWLKYSDTARRQWFADISHELRTPLAILQAEIEAMLDGVRPIHQGAIESLRQEISHLSKLVDDLNTLSSADLGALQYHKQVLDLSGLLEGQIEAHRSAMTAAGLNLHWCSETSGEKVHGDPTRLSQLLDNLLANSLKYTDAPGQVRVSLEKQGRMLQLTVEDSAPAVPSESLQALFDHLYRVEDSRNRASGGSGLGLAICRRIVEAHHGAIEARLSELGGLAIVVHIPEDANYGR